MPICRGSRLHTAKWSFVPLSAAPPDMDAWLYVVGISFSTQPSDKKWACIWLECVSISKTEGLPSVYHGLTFIVLCWKWEWSMQFQICSASLNLEYLLTPKQQYILWTVIPLNKPDLLDMVASEKLNYLLWFLFNPRINLSPFTKDFRGEEHYNESIDYFL